MCLIRTLKRYLSLVLVVLCNIGSGHSVNSDFCSVNTVNAEQIKNNKRLILLSVFSGLGMVTFGSGLCFLCYLLGNMLDKRIIENRKLVGHVLKKDGDHKDQVSEVPDVNLSVPKTNVKSVQESLIDKDNQKSIQNETVADEKPTQFDEIPPIDDFNEQKKDFLGLFAPFSYEKQSGGEVEAKSIDENSQKNDISNRKVFDYYSASTQIHKIDCLNYEGVPNIFKSFDYIPSKIENNGIRLKNKIFFPTITNTVEELTLLLKNGLEPMKVLSNEDRVDPSLRSGEALGMAASLSDSLFVLKSFDVESVMSKVWENFFVRALNAGFRNSDIHINKLISWSNSWSYKKCGGREDPLYEIFRFTYALYDSFIHKAILSDDLYKDSAISDGDSALPHFYESDELYLNQSWDSLYAWTRDNIQGKLDKNLGFFEDKPDFNGPPTFFRFDVTENDTMALAIALVNFISNCICSMTFILSIRAFNATHENSSSIRQVIDMMGEQYKEIVELYLRLF